MSLQEMLMFSLLLIKEVSVHVCVLLSMCKTQIIRWDWKQIMIFIQLFSFELQEFSDK